MIAVLSMMFALTSVSTGKDFFASVIQLQDIFDREGHTLDGLESSINQLQETLQEVLKRVHRRKEERNLVIDVSEYLQNPINSFVFLRSITDYSYILDDLMNQIQDLGNLLNERKPQPTLSDLEGAANAILRLQTTFDLDTHLLVKGIIGNHQAAPLSAIDCITIAEMALRKKDNNIARSWFHESLNSCQDCDPILKINVTEVVAYSEFLLGNLTKSLELTNLLLDLEEDHPRAKSNKIFLDEEIRHLPASQRSGKFMLDPTGQHDQDKLYHFSCRGFSRPSVELLSLLKCQYIHYNNPYYRIGPIKEEVAYTNPRIVILKDVISASEIQEIQTLSKEHLERSLVQTGVSDDIRVSKVAWLEPDDGRIVSQLTSRFADYADLSIKSAEALQVVNYGLGGHYLAHYDAFDEENSKKQWGSIGNRIATFLVYLNNVEKGGHTVFPDLGLSVQPEVGSAVLWYNLLNDSSIDRRTLHAACPVLIGTKWAINLWYHEADNDQKKPCIPQQ